jgi:hypothetical protein
MVTSPTPGMSSVSVWANVHDIVSCCAPELPCTISRGGAISWTTLPSASITVMWNWNGDGMSTEMLSTRCAGAASELLSTSVTAWSAPLEQLTPSTKVLPLYGAAVAGVAAAASPSRATGTFGLQFYRQVAEAETRAACAAATRHGGMLIDYLHILGGAEGTADPARFLGQDHAHPGDAGIKAIADLLVQTGGPELGKARVVPQVEGYEPYIAGMTDIILGVLAILAGGVMLFAGQLVLRFVLPIWGFFVGFAFGAGLVADLADERFLGTVLGWMLGLFFALLFAVFAYLYYAVAVILAMAAFGFAIGSGLVVALGIDWNWVAVLVGVAFGAVIGLVSIFGNMPMIVLVVFSSFAGAVGVVAGLMLLVGSLDSADFTQGAFTDAVKDSWGWYLTLLVLAFVGIFAQARQRVMMRRTIQEVWYAESG